SQATSFIFRVLPGRTSSSGWRLSWRGRPWDHLPCLRRSETLCHAIAGRGLHDSIDAKAHSHGDFAAGWRFDDRSARPAKRDSSRTRHYTRTGGVCGVATFLAPATDFGRRHREDNWGVELVSPHAETAPGFRHRDSNV